MGRKRETLLKWVNCCCESGEPFERLHELSNGFFFLQILGHNSSTAHPFNTCPWVTIVKLLKEINITEEIINFNSAALGDEEEIAKLIAICMHLTMVLRPRDDIKEKTMNLLSAEDQMIIKTILHAIVNDEQMSRQQLADIVYDATQEFSLSRGACTFYTSSPASSVGKNSPLKRYLDSPMAMRLSRLQREINEKNEEIRRLQTDMISESDENTILRQRMDDLNRKVKEMEKKNCELVKRLDECRSEGCPGDQPADAHLEQIKKQLKRLQSDYEIMSQKYCDLNISHENLLGQRDKDRKQMRQLQHELNEEVARLQRETADLQLQLDTVQTENMELKHLLVEKKQWIEVLEDQSRNCATEHNATNHHHHHHHLHRLQSGSPRSSGILSPNKNNESIGPAESIGFTLLSLEVEKLQDELTSNRTELFVEKEKLKSEREAFQLQEQSLNQEIARVNQQLEDTVRTNQELHQQLEQTQSQIRDVMNQCALVQQEKVQFATALDDLRSESSEQKHLIQKLEQKLEETLRRRDAFEKQIETLENEKVQLLQRITILQQENLETLANFEEKRGEFQRDLQRIQEQLQSNLQQMAEQSTVIQQLEQQLMLTRSNLETISNESAQWQSESQRLALQSSALEKHLQQTTEDFQTHLASANQQLEEGRNQLNLRDEALQALRSEMDNARRTIDLQNEKSSHLEQLKDKLSSDIAQMQDEMARYQSSAESMQARLNSNIDSLQQQLQAKEIEFVQQCDATRSLEQARSELLESKEELLANILALEKEKEHQNTHRAALEQQIDELNTAVECGKAEMDLITTANRNQLEALSQQLKEEESKSGALEFQLSNTIVQKDELKIRIDALETEKQALIEKTEALVQEKSQIETSSSQAIADLQAQLMTTTVQLESTQQQLAQQEQTTSNISNQLDDANREIVDARSRCTRLESEKMDLIKSSTDLQEEKAKIETSLSQAIDELNSKLTAAMNELECVKQQKSDQEMELDSTKDRLNTLVSQHEDLQARVLHLKNERDYLKRHSTALDEEKSKLKSNLSETTAAFESRLEEAARDLDSVNQQKLALEDELLTLREQIGRATEEHLDLQARHSNLETESGDLKEKLVALEQQKFEVEASLTQKTAEFQNRFSEATEELEQVKQQRMQQGHQLTVVQTQLEHLTQQQLDLQQRFDQLETERDSLNVQVSSLEEQKSQVESHLAQTVSDFESRLFQAAEQLTLASQEKTAQQQELNELQKQIDIFAQQHREQQARFDELENERNGLKELTATLENEKVQLESSLAQTTSQFTNQLTEAAKELDGVKQQRVELQNEMLEIRTQSNETTRQLEAQNESLQQKLTELKHENTEIQETLTRSVADCHQLQEQKDLLLTESQRFRDEISSLQQSFDELKTETQLTTEKLQTKLRAKNDEIASHLESIQLTEKQLQEALQCKESLEEQVETQSASIQEQSQIIGELNSRMDAFLRRQCELQDACKEMESLRNGLESSLAQTQASNAEARAQFQVDVDTVRSQLLSTETELKRKSEQLAEAEKNWKETLEKHESKISSLESEKSNLINAKNLLETERATIQDELEAARRHLQDETEKVRQSEGHLSDVRREMERLQRRHYELQLEKNSLSEQKLTIELRLSEIESSSQASRTALESELKNLRSDLDARQRQIMDQSATINTLELNLQNSCQQFRNLELQTDSLQSEIEEMSNGREELMRQCSILETAQLEHRAQIEDLNERLRHKQGEAQDLSTQLKNLVAQRERLLQDQITLEQKVAGLEADLQVLRAANEEERQSSLAAINQLEQELQKKSLEQFDSINGLQSDMEQMESTLLSVEKQLKEVSAEKDKLVQQHNRLKEEKLQLKESLESAKQQFQETSSCAQQQLEGKEREILDLMDQLKSITTQLAATSKLNGELEEKIRQLEADKESLLREKRALEEAQQRLTVHRRELESQLESVQQEMESKNTVIRLGEENVERLKSELLESTRSKEELEAEMTQRQTLQVSEKDNLSQQNTWLEEELARLKSAHQTIKAELEKERSSVAQIRAELSLEHRKEKAALEARLQLSQTQLKTLQEKVVDLSFRTNQSHAQSQLESKVGMLTTDLEEATKAKSDLEKKLKDGEEQFQEELASYKKRIAQQQQKIDELTSARSSRSPSNTELMLHKKYEALKALLNEKEGIIEQCNADLDKLKAHISGQQEEMASLAAEKKKLTFENRTLKTEQQYLLAQISAEKDRAAAKSSRLSLALQRGSSCADSGSLADNLIDARRRSLRPSRSEVVTRQLDNEVFKAPRLVLGDGNETFKVPSMANSRRESTSSIASNRSDASTASRAGMLPHGAGRFFTAEDEDGELFSSSYLNEMKEGKCRVGDPSVRRMSELHRRNTLQPPHMRSAYPAEMNDERLRYTDLPIAESSKTMESDATSICSSVMDGATTDRSVQQLATATSLLSVSTPPAMNTRKRRSWAEMNETPATAVPAKRRSVEKDRLSLDSMHSVQSDTRSLTSSMGSDDRTRTKRRESTTYQRPGPPTPARGSSMKENITTPSTSSTPRETPKSNKAAPGSSKQKKNVSPQSSRTTRLTPMASFARKVQSKLMNNKSASASGESTPGSSTTPRGRSKLNIFRKPLGSRGYNSEVAKF